MYDLIIIGAGPAGIALAAEARAMGHSSYVFHLICPRNVVEIRRQ